MQVKSFTLVGCLIAMSLCAHASAAATPAPGVQVEQAWIRWLPADIPAGGYMTLDNIGDVDRVLVGVTSVDYGDIQIHQSFDDHGVSKMRPVESITLKPHLPFRFSEGGYHLMLMQPKRAVHPGDAVVLTLRFDAGPPVDAVFKVRAGG